MDNATESENMTAEFVVMTSAMDWNQTVTEVSVETTASIFAGPVERTVLVALIAAFQVVGTIGNLLVLIVYAKRLRRPGIQFHNYMIFALAVGDIATLLIYGTFYQAARQVVFNNALCQAWQFFGVFFLAYVHSMISIAIPLERYYAICRPHSIFGKSQLVIVVVATVVISLPIASGYAANTHVTDLEGNLVGCLFRQETFYGKVVLPVGTFVSFVLYLLVAFILYGIIFSRILKLRKCSAVQKKAVDLAAKTKVAIMLFGVTIVYFACYAPYFLIAFRAITYHNRYRAYFFFNNATNFIVYALLNKKVRDEMAAIVCFARKCRSTTKYAESRTESTVMGVQSTTT